MAFQSHLLAPLQQMMLRDSLADCRAGAHVEQLGIVFEFPVPAPQVVAAWTMMIAQAEVLRMAFVLETPIPSHWQAAAALGAMTCPGQAPADFEKWLETDRSMPLCHPFSTPWRAVYWASEQRFLWSFHHALLDGRSITSLTRYFLECLFENVVPPPLGITHWSPSDTAMRARALKYFHENFSNLAPAAPPPRSTSFSKISQTLDLTIMESLKSCAAELAVSPATLLLWAWGQAIARVAGMPHAIIEQVRCGPPQPGRLGFSMNTLPLLIPRCNGGTAVKAAIRLLGQQLRYLREIEAISPLEQPAMVRELTSSAWSSVVMIETCPLDKLNAMQQGVRSITLHENPGASLTATARITSGLRLEVEGHASAELLKMWVQSLTQLCSQCAWL